jgi:hypothetical protein
LIWVATEYYCKNKLTLLQMSTVATWVISTIATGKI